MRAPERVEQVVADALGNALPVRQGGAFTTVLAEEALTEARRADERLLAGAAARPLEATTLAVKDLVAVSGHPIGAGSASRAGAAPEIGDAAIVAALRRLGAVVVGLAALHELAFGVTGVNCYEGSPQNPLDARLVPGGSSSGSALAVATGSATLAVGTDTGGSVRVPAACCGVVGFKPGYGEYPVAGVLALAPSLDHVGLLARSLEPIRRAHAALGHDAGRPALPPRVGLDEEALRRSSPPVRAAVDAAVKALTAAGVAVVSPPLPDADLVAEASTLILFSEAAAVHRAAFGADPSRFGGDVRRRLELARELASDSGAVARARRGADEIRRQLATALDSCDVLVSPTLPRLAPALEEAADERVSAELVSFTRLYNLAGTPALSLPLSLPARAGIALQLAAKDSASLLGAAAAVEGLLAGDSGR